MACAIALAVLAFGAALAQLSFRSEQYSVTVTWPELLVPNCPDALFAATSAFVQLEYAKTKASTPLGLRLEPATRRVVYNAQYALGFTFDLELSVIVTPSGVQLGTAYSSTSVPSDVATQALWDYAERVSKKQLEWITATVKAEPCRFDDLSVTSNPANSNVPAPPMPALALNGRIQFSQPTQNLSSAECDRNYGALARPAALTNLEPISAGCVLIRRLNAEQFQLELKTQMAKAAFTLLSSVNVPILTNTTAYSQLWRSAEKLLWLRYGSGTNTVMLWQEFAVQ